MRPAAFTPAMAKPLRYPRHALPGRQRPNAHRLCPSDFRERYLEMGWDGIVEHYATNWRAIARWVDESGGDELREARREAVRQRRQMDARQHRYRIEHGRHLPGWTAARIEALHAGHSA